MRKLPAAEGGARLGRQRLRPMDALLRGAVWLGLALTAGLSLTILGYVIVKGAPNLKPSLFAWNYTTQNCSMMPAIVNTLIMVALSLAVALPLGVGAAIYLTEYARRDNLLVRLIRLTAETLSGIPSILYGLFGYLAFLVTLKWKYSLLAGGLTLSVMILPVVLRTTEEALLAVSDSWREGSFGLGAGRLRTIRRILLPAAAPGILSGVILGAGRVVGETAALLYTAGSVAQVPDSLMGSGCTLSVHLYVLSSEGLHVGEAWATALVLMVLVVGINALSAAVAKKLRKE